MGYPTTLGVIGLEATYTYNGLVMNRQGRDVNHERYRVASVDGLFSQPDIKVVEQKYPERHGLYMLNVLEGGRTITLSGTIEAMNLSKMKQMELELRFAFADLTEKQLLIESTQTSDVYIMCRKVAALSLRAQQSDLRYRRAFQVNLRASDPRIYSATQKSMTALFTAATDVNFYTGTPTDAQRNMGNYYTPVIIQMGDIDGLGAWTLTNPVFRPGGLLEASTTYLGALSGGSGVYYVVDMLKGTITDQTGANAASAFWNAPNLLGAGTYRPGLTGSLYQSRAISGQSPITRCDAKTGTPKCRILWRDAWC